MMLLLVLLLLLMLLVVVTVEYTAVGVRTAKANVQEEVKSRDEKRKMTSFNLLVVGMLASLL